MHRDGTLKTGFVIAEVAYRQFTLRAITTADLLDAEQDAPASQALNYSAHLLRRQLVRVVAADGREFTGPFTVGMVRKLPPADFWVLRRAQQELDEAGEPESVSAADSGSPSS